MGVSSTRVGDHRGIARTEQFPFHFSEYVKTREFQTQLVHYFSNSDNKSNHHKQTQEWQTVLELAQTKHHNAHDAPSCHLSKLSTTEASQGGVITLTTTKITQQHDTVSFSRRTASR